MLELTSIFTRADGCERTVTIRISDVRETHPGTGSPWSAAVDILGFQRTESMRLLGGDWAGAIEYAARFAAIRVNDLVALAGGGTLEPPFEPRSLAPRSGGEACGIADGD